MAGAKGRKSSLRRVRPGCCDDACLVDPRFSRPVDRRDALGAGPSGSFVTASALRQAEPARSRDREACAREGAECSRRSLATAHVQGSAAGDRPQRPQPHRRRRFRRPARPFSSGGNDDHQSHPHGDGARGDAAARRRAGPGVGADPAGRVHRARQSRRRLGHAGAHRLAGPAGGGPRPRQLRRDQHSRPRRPASMRATSTTSPSRAAARRWCRCSAAMSRR
jgi:hypothetical protein